MSEQKTHYKGIYKAEEGVFINKDKDALLAYKKTKRQMEDYKKVKEEIETIRSDLDEIKKLLKDLVK